MLAVEFFDGHSAHLRVRAVSGVLGGWLLLLHRLGLRHRFFFIKRSVQRLAICVLT